MRDGERDEKGREHQGKGEEKRETVKAVRGGKNERGGMSPMAATHHSQLNDAIFFPPFPASFPWERQGGGVVSAGVQSNGVKQSSYPSGGTEETYALQQDKERRVDRQ